MINLFLAIGYIATFYWLITFISPKFLPNGPEVLSSIKNGTVKAWRIMHPILILICLSEPQMWWRVAIMMISIELSFIIVTPIVNRVFNKLGY